MSVHDLVQRHASATPGAIAVAAGEVKLTYGELESRANELASLLRSHGVAADVPVAVCMRRSPELVVAALGILKAGGAYVPLDPTHPAGRFSMLLDDSGTTVVLSQPDVAERLPSGKWRTIFLDKNGRVASKADPPASAAGQASAHPDNLAYIIFTSGSTGRPKGVQITHGNLLNLISWHTRAFEITAADKATLHASPGFDASVWELWPYLAAGASVHVVPEDIRTTPEQLRDWIVSTGITITFLSTAMAESMIDLPWPAGTALRFLLTGADTLRRYSWPDLPFTFVNNYGPTECSVVATSGAVPVAVDTEALPPIGRPIDNAQAYVVDEHMNCLPAGEPGELLIGGAGVGRGYLNLPELTSQKFVPDPFSKAKGARLYRTGDLACILPDGQIAFLGRMDEQIKIRGYRIEPGEITAVLDRHPTVESSFVTALSEYSNEKRLVAYVVPRKNLPLSAVDLRDFLGQELPDYMVPSTFVRIEALPISPSGKVDRAALPQPTPENILDDAPFEEPQSQVESWLATFLVGLLGVPRVSRDDNFFNLGGHSLMGAQLIAKVQQTFDVELSLRRLFDHPTVREISAEIERLIQAKLDAMSEEEAQRILESAPNGISV